MTILVKICGLSTVDTLAAAVGGGADMVGFVFFPPSPRNVSLDRARALCERVPSGIDKVGLFVDPDDDTLESVLATVPLDIVQLHGKETPARTADVATRFGKPVMKALGIATQDDLARTETFKGAASRLLLDAKPPLGADRPGGNAQAFDWTILKGWKAPMPWLLAGGLRPDNVAEALAVSGAPGVDVSSGVESAPGVKDVAAIAGLIAAARGAGPGAEETNSDDGLPKLVL